MFVFKWDNVGNTYFSLYVETKISGSKKLAMLCQREIGLWSYQIGDEPWLDSNMEEFNPEIMKDMVIREIQGRLEQIKVNK